MKISARNQLQGTVADLHIDGVTAEVTVDVGGGTSVVAVITSSSVQSLGLKVGDRVAAVVKATDVMIATP